MWRRLLAYELEEEQKMVMSRLDRDINLHVTISCHDQKFIFQLDSLFLQLIFLNIWQSVSITPLPVRSCCFSQNSYFIFCNPDEKRQVRSMQTTTDWEEMFDTGKENHHYLLPSNYEQSQNHTNNTFFHNKQKFQMIVWTGKEPIPPSNYELSPIHADQGPARVGFWSSRSEKWK